MKNEIIVPLVDLSRLFLQSKKVYRYRMKKISGMTDSEVIRTCHFYVEENGLTDEWESFREANERASDSTCAQS